MASLDDLKKRIASVKSTQKITKAMKMVAAALNKSIIVIHNDEHQHALKEVDAAASAVAKDQYQVVRILKYILEGSLN